jgi:hypothetical protein
MRSLFVAIACALSGRTRALDTCLSLSLNATVSSRVAPYFASWNIDPSRDRLFFDVDFTSPLLLKLVAGIGGPSGNIRFGGTGADHLWYEVPGAAPCKPTIPEVYECLNATLLSNLYGVGAAANMSIVFGLNINNDGSVPWAPKGSWDPSNARALLAAAKKTGHTLFGLEAGNEQNDNMTPQQQAGVFATLSKVLDDVYGSGPDRPRLVGPDTHSFRTGTGNAATLKYLATFAQATEGILGALTHHEYLEITSENVLNASFLDGTAAIAASVMSAIRAVSSVAVWAGEIGPHNGGTFPSPNCEGNHVCGRFGSLVWYADSMSIKALAGYEAFNRQDVVGADYALINATAGGGFVPSPDYWGLALWKRVVSPRTGVLRVAAPGGGVRAYAFCGGGRAALVLINLASAPACVAPPAQASTTAPVYLYALTPGAEGVVSPNALLNGKLLVAGADGSLPPPTGLSVAAGATITLPPTSVSFVDVALQAGLAPECA